MFKFSNYALVLLFSCFFFSCSTDACDETVWFFDSDGDGFGGKSVAVSACEQPEHFVDNFDDFDESDPNLNPNSIWSGLKITFTKESGVNGLIADHQDKITNDVWITRGDRNSIFNVKLEDGAQYYSPENTLWARGTTDDFSELNFSYFRYVLYGNIGNEILNTDLVLYLPEEGIYIDIKFTEWESARNGGAGGFSYESSTPNR